MSAGFYLMHRGWQDHPVFRGEAFSRRDAFVWMIEEAAYRDRRASTAQGEIALARGQFSHSLRFMARAWKWDEAKVRRFIAAMSRAEIIDATTDAGQTVINIRNYAKYQAMGTVPDAAPDARATQRRRSGDANKKEGNQGKEVIEDANASSPRKRAERLPEGWTPERLDRSTAAGEIVQRRGAEWARVTFETFENYWRAKSGKDATKLDWQATWKNWVIAQDKRDGNGTARNGSHPRNGGSGNGFIDAINEAKASDWGSKNPH